MAYLDTCPDCPQRTTVAPLAVSTAGPGQLVADYLCPAGHTWHTGWAAQPEQEATMPMPETYETGDAVTGQPTPAQRAKLDQFAADARRCATHLLDQARTHLAQGVDRDVAAYGLARTVRDALRSGQVSVDQAAMELAWLVTRWPDHHAQTLANLTRIYDQAVEDILREMAANGPGLCDPCRRTLRKAAEDWRDRGRHSTGGGATTGGAP